MDDYRLNDPNNLNAQFKKLPQGYLDEHKADEKSMQQQKEQEQKEANERAMNEFNNRPDVVRRNIQAVDKDEYERLERNYVKMKSFAFIITAAAFIILAGAVATIAYVIYQDGTLLPEPDNLDCGDTVVEPTEIPACPEFPEIPACPEIPECPSFPEVLDVNIIDDTV